MMKMTSALSGNEHCSTCNYLSNFRGDGQNMHGYIKKKFFSKEILLVTTVFTQPQLI